jgi:hypothetical protein
MHEGFRKLKLIFATASRRRNQKSFLKGFPQEAVFQRFFDRFSNYLGGDWLQVVVIAFKGSPSSGCTLLAAGLSRAANGWSPTASNGLNG